MPLRLRFFLKERTLTILVFSKIAALTCAAFLLFLPLRHVAVWDDHAWLPRFVVSALATLVWLAVGLLAMDAAREVQFVALGTLALLCLLACASPAFRNVVPFLRWAQALRHRVLKDSPKYIVEHVLCLRPVPADGAKRDYKASYRPYDDDGEAVLTFSCKVSGVTDEYVEKKALAGLGAIGAETCKVEHLAPGRWRLRFYTGEAPSRLDDSTAISAADLSAWDGRRVAYGIDENGETVYLTYAETSGIVVGGVPGGGKSAGATVLTASLLASEKAEVMVFDGKGGLDWGWAADKAVLYDNDCDVALETATRELEELAQRCIEDLKNHVWSESDPDFWHAGASAEHPFHLVVIDECQTLFDTGGRSKEEKALMERCKKAVATIVRKGRSAGWCVMLLTQKPTADSIPTNIRDNCLQRFALRVTTREAADAVLGSVPDGDPRPTDIPSSRRGGVVVQGEDGHTKSARFYYLPPAEAVKFLNESRV